jgi:hypothetical protein
MGMSEIGVGELPNGGGGLWAWVFRGSARVARGLPGRSGGVGWWERTAVQRVPADEGGRAAGVVP